MSSRQIKRAAHILSDPLAAEEGRGQAAFITKMRRTPALRVYLPQQVQPQRAPPQRGRCPSERRVQHEAVSVETASHSALIQQGLSRSKMRGADPHM
ncbi:hypothetical protein QQF64_012018 [Cirrhinus molitorella]|uniref:Uncharacterized protein n=1 Tax=Cirrhinus molitorella TaxID=172907 RepID=A0ABR3LYE0_9TELE